MTCHLYVGIKYIQFYLNLWANFSRLWWVEYCQKEDLPWSKNSVSSLGHGFVFLCIRKTLPGASPPLSTLFNPTSPLTRCVSCPHIKQFCDTSWVFWNSVLFQHCLFRFSIRSHKFKGSVLQDCPHFICQSQISVVTCTTTNSQA